MSQSRRLRSGAQLVSESAAGLTVFQIVVLLYLPLVSAALAVFACRRGATGRWVMSVDPELLLQLQLTAWCWLRS